MPDLISEKPALSEADREAELEDLSPRMTLGEHLEELRRRLFFSAGGLVLTMVLCLLFGKQLLNWVEMPFHIALTKLGMDSQLAVMSVAGVFTTYLRVSCYAGIVLASPWVAYQLWSFVAAGLYRHERRYVHLAIPFSAALFLAGAAMAVQVAVPAIEFFIRFGNDLGIRPIITLDEYIGFMTSLLLAFGLVFQVPLVVLVLAKVGLVDLKMFRHYRPHAIVVMAIISAFLAPPDIVSMLVMMLPMCLLYELGIVLAWLLVFRKEGSRQ